MNDRASLNAAAPAPLRLLLDAIEKLGRLDGGSGAACLVTLTLLMLAEVTTGDSVCAGASRRAQIAIPRIVDAAIAIGPINLRESRPRREETMYQFRE